MYIEETDYLEHIGTPRHSGRYPWGSGGDEQLHNHMNFADHVKYLKTKGLSQAKIAEGMGLKSSTELRQRVSIANAEIKQAKIVAVERLAAKEMSNVAIGKQLGMAESTVRSLRADGVKEKATSIKNTADMLEGEVKKKKWVDVGKGTENYMNVSKERLNTSLIMLQDRGYMIHKFKRPQLGTSFETEYKVLAMPGTTQKDAFLNWMKLKLPGKHSDNNGLDFDAGDLPPISIHPDRVKVRYGPEGGSKADGVIYVRHGVKDISLENARYAQVRVMVGNNHFLKGMAMYKEDMPKGTDLIFNTNKTSTGNKLDAMKKIKNADGTTEEDPMVSVRRQIFVHDKNGKRKVTSAMNIVNEEGDWKDWSNSISSQVLSKQEPKLVKEQLDMTYESRKLDYDAITKLTNPTVRKKFLEDFADATDSDAVDLDAYRLPRQAWHAILPVESMRPDYVYAPKYDQGETVALIRYPHGGTFEIPILKVNNRQPEAVKMLGKSPADAIGIHPKVAEKLSGADFDGDTVLVIPNGKGRIKASPSLKALEGFEPKTIYKKYDGMPKITKDRMQFEMGSISNLITDMTIAGAPHEDIARAVKHSMVVIDSEKHYLNYKQSAIDNNISQLKKQYQGSPKAGAATLLSLATSGKFIDERKKRTVKEGGPIDLATGKRMFEPTNKMVKNKKGEIKPKQEKVKRLSLEDDAFALSSGLEVETIYAKHSNRLKALANKSRLEGHFTPSLKYSKQAAKVYADQVATLNASLKTAEMNAPLERQAQIMGLSIARTKRGQNPDMTDSTYKKVKFKALTEARLRTGSGKKRIKISPKEWEAIQAGAISNHKLTQIMTNADSETLRELATPKNKKLMTATKTNRAKAMLAQGYTQSEVANMLGVSMSTLERSI